MDRRFDAVCEPTIGARSLFVKRAGGGFGCNASLAVCQAACRFRDRQLDNAKGASRGCASAIPLEIGLAATAPGKSVAILTTPGGFRAACRTSYLPNRTTPAAQSAHYQARHEPGDGCRIGDQPPSGRDIAASPGNHRQSENTDFDRPVGRKRVHSPIASHAEYPDARNATLF